MNTLTLYSDDTPKGHAMFFGGKLIDTFFCQPLEYFKVARQVEYVTNTKKYFMDNGLSKHYKSVLDLNINGYLTGQTMSLLQAGSYGLNAIFLYPLMLQYFNSINDTSPNKEFKNSLYAGAAVGTVQGIINVPLENLKLRQIGNRLLSNYPKDFKFNEHPNSFVVSDFQLDDIQNQNKTHVNKAKAKQNGIGIKNKEYIESLKKLDSSLTTKRGNAMSYIDLKHRITLGYSGVKTNSEYYNILKVCKKSADSMLKKPSVGVISTIKEMIESGKFDGKNIFLNAWYLTVPIAIIETTIFIASLQKLRQCVYEYNSGVEYQDMSIGGKAYLNIKELSYKIPGLHQFAPLFIGIPSAFLTVALTQPLDSLKTILQSGLFHRFRALSDSKVFTLPTQNVISAFKAYYGSYVDVGKLYNGALFRFLKLSLIHVGLGFTFSRSITNYLDTYLEKRKLAS
ncbi:uncharacterized protein HGUI_03919 [Hanseniaspora guilliermondii]|uniref:Mitochondrial carrier protein n=1 Tax=Hanseniaspora guilliermondii TaxID=56406 RepID=A0A1L0FQ70_9ASCO|nr:uncharacterized protein HGUI_03919 [Hanseniaspora guilliermondii]